MEKDGALGGGRGGGSRHPAYAALIFPWLQSSLGYEDEDLQDLNYI